MTACDHMKRRVVSRGEIDALVFDLDGVVTSTAELHALAWKKLFDRFLEQCDLSAGCDRSPFRLPEDYRDHVDGKPRADGVRDFLISRGINLPEGNDGDGPDKVTLNGLGARKDSYYHELLDERGVPVFASSVEFIRKARRLGFKTAIASSSKNCLEVLRYAKLEQLFDSRVDGNDLLAKRIKGKPDPGMFLEALRILEVEAERAAVFEDAVSGVEAGRAGGFGLVVGIDRGGQVNALLAHGADIVVDDLSRLELEDSEP